MVEELKFTRNEDGTYQVNFTETRKYLDGKQDVLSSIIYRAAIDWEPCEAPIMYPRNIGIMSKENSNLDDNNPRDMWEVKIFE